MSCMCMIKVKSVHSITLRGNMFELAQNVQESYVESQELLLIYVCGIGGV